MKSSLLVMWFAVAGVLAAAYAGYTVYRVGTHDQRSDQNRAQLPPLESFELTTSTGDKLRSQDMRGQVWVTTFFFTNCPGSCKRLNANIKYLNTLEDIQDVNWLSISVDPVADTLPVLRKYAEERNADPQQWYFATADLGYLKRLGTDTFKLPVSYQGHNDFGVVIDRYGEIAGYYNVVSSKDSERMREKLRECLAQPGPAPGAKHDTVQQNRSEPDTPQEVSGGEAVREEEAVHQDNENGGSQPASEPQQSSSEAS